MKTKPKPTFAARLKSLRAESGLSAARLAATAGIALSYYRQLENGLRPNPSWGVVRKLANALEVSTEAFC